MEIAVFRKEHGVDSPQLQPTILPEYGTPYPHPTRALQALRNAIETTMLNKASLNAAGEKIRSHYSFIGQLDQPMTGDGYQWFSGCIFALPRGEIVVLIPWSHDAPHRAVTIYARSECTPEEINDMLWQFATAINAMRKSP